MAFIRAEHPEDRAAIEHVLQEAFDRPDEARLVDALCRRDAYTVSLVAQQDDRIVGHILFSPVAIGSERAGCRAVALGPMAVLPELQRQGIGTQLVQAGLEKCRHAGYDLVVVLGHPEYYPRFGFTPARPHGIHSEFDVPDEVFMVLKLHDGALTHCSGVVRYEPEFYSV